jgi:hypothetical protein
MAKETVCISHGRSEGCLDLYEMLLLSHIQTISYNITPRSITANDPIILSLLLCPNVCQEFSCCPPLPLCNALTQWY